MLSLRRLGTFAALAAVAAAPSQLACGSKGDDTPAATAAATSGAGGTSSSQAATVGIASSVASTAASSSSSSSSGTGGASMKPWHDMPPALTVANCTDEGFVVVPSPGNESHLAAARLTPPKYPFQVTSVVYEIAQGEKDAPCDSSLKHHVEVFVGTDPKPVAMPMLVANLPVAAIAAQPFGSTRLVSLTLPQPIVLKTGEHLFVAVEMAGTQQQHLCVAMCANTGSFDRNWWSNAKVAPYNWATLQSFGNSSDLRIGADGKPQ